MNPFGRIGAGIARLKAGLGKTRQVFQRLLVATDNTELEELLLSADVGIRATGRPSRPRTERIFSLPSGKTF